MSDVKASGASTALTLIKQKGKEFEDRLNASLSSETHEIVLKMAVTSMISYAHEAEVLNAAANLLYPNHVDRLRRLGRDVAQNQFSGIYRIFFRIPTINYIIRRVSQTWELIHARGNAVIEDLEGKKANLIVRGLPQLPPIQREYICGFITGMMELTGAKNTQVTKNEKDPNAWKWQIQYE